MAEKYKIVTHGALHDVVRTKAKKGHKKVGKSHHTIEDAQAALAALKNK